MRNPFEPVKVEEKPLGEEVGGSFSCQYIGCYEQSHEGMYYGGVLRWTCPKGHVCEVKIEL